MAEQNFPDNTIYELDNLDVLRGMNSETVDLIATDPPFNTGQTRSGEAGSYLDSWRWGRAGTPPDPRAWNEVNPVWLEEVRGENQSLSLVIETAGECHGQGMAAFLCFLSIRLLEMHRVLKPTGSIYLHCDNTASAYIRMALDAVFGAGNFRNEIAWKRNGSHNDARKFGSTRDTIIFHSKSRHYTWTDPRAELDEEYIAKMYRSRDSRGVYRTAPLHTGGLSGGGYDFEFHGFRRTWKCSETRMKELETDGRIRRGRDGRGIPERKIYLHESKGMPMSDWWDDIKALTGRNNERTGSPDQKPLALYERIVLASSNPGDMVLDPFAGCGTTLAAARNHNRRWVGIDRRPDTGRDLACRMMGLKPREADRIRANPMYRDWLTAQLAELESRCRTEPPVRTDEGETVPLPKAVQTIGRTRPLTLGQMTDFLLRTFGLRCWGCDFIAPDPRYLQLDHADPRSAGGSSRLENRALLCQPCSQVKANRITLIQLRRENARSGYLTKPAGSRRSQDDHPIDLLQTRQKCREALERHRAGDAATDGNDALNTDKNGLQPPKEP